MFLTITNFSQLKPKKYIGGGGCAPDPAGELTTLPQTPYSCRLGLCPIDPAGGAKGAHPDPLPPRPTSTLKCQKSHLKKILRKVPGFDR